MELNTLFVLIKITGLNMLIITNRNINQDNFEDGVGNENAFGDKVNIKGPNEVRIAYAKKYRGKWKVSLVDEPSKITEKNIPSKKEFLVFRENLTKKKKNCVFFIHGFNQSFKKNLEKCYAIEKKHNVEVIAFSWPSNPGGFKLKEYRHAKRTARASIGALDATFEKMGKYLRAPFNREALIKCDVKFTILAHSLGNYLLQNYIVDTVYDDETNLFDNIVLCQSDVDNQNHANWINKVEVGKRVYVTINENDWVLKWSDINFQKARLGRTVKNLNADNVAYFDFTDGPNVGNTHGVFYKDTNPIVKDFFTDVLNGKRGEEVTGFNYHSRTNTFRF